MTAVFATNFQPVQALRVKRRKCASVSTRALRDIWSLNLYKHVKMAKNTETEQLDPESHNEGENRSGANTRICKKQIVPLEVKNNEIYVTRRRPLVVYYNRAMKLLTTTMYHNTIYSERLGCRRNKKMIRDQTKSKQNEIIIHGMGACIMTAIWLVQDLKSHFGDKISVETSTSTIKVVDELVNDEKEWESESKTRYLSSISMKITLNNVKFTI